MREKTFPFEKVFLEFRLCAPLFFIAVISCAAQSLSESDKTQSIIQFLDNSWQDYEVCFSITQHYSESSSNALAELNRKMSLNVEVLYDCPIYYGVRRSRDGFYTQTGTNIGEVRREGLTANGRGVHGVVSNTFWSAENNLIYIDSEKLVKLQMERGMTWQELADQTTGKVLTLGLLIRPGTLEWKGTNFTAEAAMRPPVPKQARGQRVVAGSIQVTDGAPSRINYSIGAMQFGVELSYAQKVDGPFDIPSRVRVNSQLREGSTNEITIDILSLYVTNFPPNSTGPDNVMDPNKQNTIIVSSGKGNASMTAFQGRVIRPVPVAVTGWQEATTNKLSRRWIVVYVLIITSFFSCYLLFRKRKGVSPRVSP